NGDGKLDFIVADDGQDRYCLNSGNGTDGLANFVTFVISGSPSEFGNSIAIADLNNDGRKDVIVTDVDSDLGPFCPTSGRTTKFYRNTGTDSALFVNEAGTVPSTEQTGWTDAAIFDINGDGWRDIVSGTCAGINVYMNTPPINMSWSIVGSVPSTVPPGQATVLTANATIVGGGSIVSGSAKLSTRINNGAWTESALTPVSSTQFLVNLPALNCGQSLDWYISARLSNTGTATWLLPTGGAAAPFELDPVSGTEVIFESEFETGVAGWTVENTSITFGAWELGDPIGTNSGSTPVQPENDNSATGVNCWFTGQGAVGGTAATGDVDGGPTNLVSPVFTIGGQDVTISYARWFACIEPTAAEVDSLSVDVRVDGGAWRNFETFTASSGSWLVYSGKLSSTMAPGNTMQVRFVARDNPNNSTTDAAIDSIRIDRVVCTQPPACPGDLDNNHAVDGADLGVLLGQWGGGGSADLDGNGTVDGADLGAMLGGWGACP
ncbi:MAG: VCBS repeat-containing protein, partial [Phycisphaerae bacterium]|nr:VCBS repeat-containing protein [Phycisphaerae bacterium]